YVDTVVTWTIDLEESELDGRASRPHVRSPDARVVREIEIEIVVELEHDPSPPDNVALPIALWIELVDEATGPIPEGILFRARVRKLPHRTELSDSSVLVK